jgi:hypothetical protein
VPAPNPLFTPLNLGQSDDGAGKRSKRKESSLSNLDKPYEQKRKIPLKLYYLLKVIDHDQADKQSDSAKDQSASLIRCGNKLCTRTHQKGVSEEGWSRRKFGEGYSWFCKDCSSAFVKRQYCDFCMQIYTDVAQEGAIVDGLDWIQCEDCDRWTHVKCEAEKGFEDIKELKNDPQFNYVCVECEKTGSSGKKKKKAKVVHRYELIYYG